MTWIQVRDVRQTRAQPDAADVPVIREPALEPWGLIEMQFEDADGTRIGLAEVLVGRPLP